MSARRTLLLAVACATVAIWAIAWSTPRDFRVGNYVDDAHYVMLAKAIRTGGRYRTLNLPGAPPETKYPPAFPLLLATTWSAHRSDAANLERLRWVNLWLVGAVAAALVLVGAVTFGLDPWVAAVLAVAGLVSPHTMELWTAPLSEPLFLLLVIVGTLLGTVRRPGWAVACLLGAVYVRTVAAPFLVGSVAAAGIAARRVPVRLAVAVGAGLAPWLLWQVIQGGAVPDAAVGMHGSYGRWYFESLAADPGVVLLRVPVTNLLQSLQGLGEGVLAVRIADDLLATALGGLVLLGLWRVRARAPGLLIGLIGYGLIVLAWPFPPVRFVAAVWPLCLVAAGSAVPRRMVAAGVAGTALVLGLVAVRNGQGVLTHRIRTRLSDATIARLESRVPPGAVLATTNPPLYYLRFGTPAVPSQKMRSTEWYRTGSWEHAWGDGQDLLNLIETFAVTLVVAEGRPGEGSPIAEVRAACPDFLRPVDVSAPEEGPFRVDPQVGCAL